MMSGTRGIGQRGYVALLTVLIVGALSLAVGTSLLLSGADASRAALVAQQAAQARNLASACAEDALQVAIDPTATTNVGTRALAAGNCRYEIITTSATERTIRSSGRVDDVVKYVTVYATIFPSSISVISWQENP